LKEFKLEAFLFNDFVCAQSEEQMFKVLFTTCGLIFALCACQKVHLDSAATKDFQQSNIIGGEVLDASAESRASSVELVAIDKQGPLALCSGTLIAPNMVLTAAHCGVFAKEGKSILIGFGLNTTESYKHFRWTKAYRLHPKYDSSDLRNNNAYDLAILKFTGDLPTGFHARALPAKDFAINRAGSVEIVGYGMTLEEAHSTTGILRHAVIPASRILKQMSSRSGREVLNFPGAIILSQENTGICNGDSGGPLYQVNSDNSLTLLGVSSQVWNLESDTRACHHHAVFTDVRQQLSWVKTAMTELNNVN
jgi:secreted trypsin-like serine protease